VSEAWQLFIDTGGTFTDAVAIDPQSCFHTTKVLSNSALRGTINKQLEPLIFQIVPTWPIRADVLTGGRFRLLSYPDHEVPIVAFMPGANQVELAGRLPVTPEANCPFEICFDEEAPILAARLLTGTPYRSELPRIDLRLGTTLATNALLTRGGARTAHFITRGFGDLLTIGTQQRPELFSLSASRPASLATTVVEVDARVSANGSVLTELDLQRLDPVVQSLLADSINCAAITLLHADRFPAHEVALAEYLKQAGFKHVSCSSGMAREVRILPRAETTVVDAYLAPMVSDYLQRIRSSLTHGRMLVMTSAGGLMATSSAHSKDMLLSGPAGGVVGAAGAAVRTGTRKILSFDMGGTSTDVARYDDAHDYVFEHRVGDAHLFAPALAIETVAAGGGSICQWSDGALAVGPDSAGADPGPACYGSGGPLTLTDVNLLLGRLDPNRFGIPVAEAPAQRALQEVLARLKPDPADPESNQPPTQMALLEGFLQIANERMADAMRRISIRRGYDPADHTLVTFGGAGGQHACAVADLLGITRILVPADAGLLSAWGMAWAMVERFASRQLLAPLNEAVSAVPEVLATLASEATHALFEDGIPESAVTISRRLAEMRSVGQESALQVELPPDLEIDADSLHAAFATRYQAIYGHQPEKRPVELVALRVVAASRPAAGFNRSADRSPASSDPRKVGQPHQSPAGFAAENLRRVWFSGRWLDVPVYLRESLPAGITISGPALIFDPHSGTVVAPGWEARLSRTGALVMSRVQRVPEAADRDRTGRNLALSHPEPVQVELFSARLTAIAREMGAALERTAVSTNVKERLDFSCAVLDARGGLVVNAPHIPVHLGSLGMCVRTVNAALDLQPGDMAVTNHPACGGSHLPDLTVVAPVYLRRQLLGFVAARAHHAEIGGVRPGSMPPAATRLSEEGVIIPPTLVMRNGQMDLAAVTDRLLAGPHPTRALADNLADLRAAVAACHQGAQALIALASEQGSAVVAHYMAALEERAAVRMAEALAGLGDGAHAAEQRLDDGTLLAVHVTIAGGEAIVDFTGSAAVHPGNLNATPAIVHSVVVYVLRLLVQEDIPLNEGLLRPVRIVIPPGILSPPFGTCGSQADPAGDAHAPSIVGGNVETSQRLVDLLLLVLNKCAASQGTMNNLLFGNAEFSYYETVGGGCGAGPGWHGPSGVHSHMTNTRITDPELLELRYPVRLDRFSLRRRSGGRGRWWGGDGLVREFTFLSPLELSLLSQRRLTGPYGLAGGEPGQPGSQVLLRADGSRVVLPGIVACEVQPGDRLVLETPGGGGFGKVDSPEVLVTPDAHQGTPFDSSSQPGEPA